MSARPPEFDDAFREQLATLFAWRRDVRRFRPAPVDPALVELLLEQACLSPSVGNSQPWRFVLVTDPARREAVTENFRRENAEALRDYDGARAVGYARLKLAGLVEAPVHLAVFCDPDTQRGHGLGRRTMPEMLAYSTVASVQTLWLAARAAGLGVGWVSILDPADVRAALDVPEDWRLVAYLCLGWPEEEHEDPELERADWQARGGLADFLTRR
ncbi:MAG: 5,6-dimethylbenzimidazole synthase [Alphaproteobacteria bacterium]